MERRMGERRDVPDGDGELVDQLKRLRSDLGFRLWTTHRVRIVAILVAFDMLVSVGTVAALIGVRRVQQDACHADNDLRRAYINQWEPLLIDAQKQDDPASRETVARFSTAFESFKVHDC